MILDEETVAGGPNPSITAVLGWIAAVHEDDAVRLSELSAEDIVIIGPRGGARGRALLSAWLMRVKPRFEVKRIFGRGENVVVEQEGAWDAIDGDRPRRASRFVVRDGVVATLERDADLASSLRAAGLTEDDLWR